MCLCVGVQPRRHSPRLCEATRFAVAQRFQEVHSHCCVFTVVVSEELNMHFRV